MDRKTDLTREARPTQRRQATLTLPKMTCDVQRGQAEQQIGRENRESVDAGEVGDRKKSREAGQADTP
jgi:hypothetical protein